MKKSILTTTIAALAIGAAFPLGAFAAPPAKLMSERGVIEKVDPAAASELKPGERADVKYARHGKQRVATNIAISPGGKTAGAHKAQAHKAAGPA